MLSIELEQTNGDSEGLPAVTKKRLEELRQHCSRIGSDVQALSHELHSSKLEYCGVVSAVRDLCRELAKQHGASIEFKDENVFLNARGCVSPSAVHPGPSRIPST